MHRNKLLARSQWAITRQVANFITQKNNASYQNKRGLGSIHDDPACEPEKPLRGGLWGAFCHDAENATSAGLDFRILLICWATSLSSLSPKGWMTTRAIFGELSKRRHCLNMASNFFQSAWPDSLAQSASCSRLAKSANESMRSVGLLAKRLTVSRA